MRGECGSAYRCAPTDVAGKADLGIREARLERFVAAQKINLPQAIVYRPPCIAHDENRAR